MPYVAEILPAADYPAVRSLIDPSLGDDIVTDGVIESDPYLLTVERAILLRWPEALAYRPAGAVGDRPAGNAPDPAVWHWVRLAAMALAASRLVDAVAASRVKRESFAGQHSYERDSWDADGLRRRLMADVDAYLANARSAAAVVVVRVGKLTGAFARASGSRGRP